MSDFINPTGQGIRISDCHGQGHFGASRGSRKHKGVDYIAEVGQGVKSVVSGMVTKIGYPYGNDLSYRYVEITNHLLKHRVRQFYVEPSCGVGDNVIKGDIIGHAQCLGKRYPDITEHVHVEIYIDGKLVNPVDFIKD